MNQEERAIPSKRYQLTLEGEDIFLRVEHMEQTTAPALSPMSIELLSGELAKRNIMCKQELLEQCFADATGENMKICTVQDTTIIGTLLDIIMAKDFMNATLKVYPSLDGSNLTPEKILSFLEAKGIKHGIKEDLFAKIINSQDCYREWLIAEGEKPQEGQDATIRFMVDIQSSALKPKELENGSVDFYDLGLIQIVDEGTVLAERIPATPGVNGKDILGQVVRAPHGKEIRLPVGANTKIIENNSKLISTQQGHVNYIGGKINVYSTFEVKGDVDFQTGNIIFPGNVVVRGSQKHSFLIEAGGDVEIFGNLEGKVIAGGNLKVNKGIVRGTVNVQGSIFVRYIENSEVRCAEELIVSEAIMHSRVMAGKKLSVSGKKGLIVGGRVTVGQEIEAKNIGAPMGTITALEVGVIPELREEYKMLVPRITKLNKEIDELQKSYNILSIMKEKTGTLPPDKNQLFTKIYRLQYQKEKEIAELKMRMMELEDIFTAAETAKIRVMNTVYSGVVITIGKSTYYVDEERNRVEFRFDEFEVRGFNI
jgi:uncharacterized protein (DUF342 family)